MIKEFLKIAGVKNEKQFYNKYPSEAAFFKAHPEAKHLKSFKKGGEMKKLEQLTDFGNPPIAKKGKEVPKLQDSIAGGIGLNAGTALGANPTGSFDWTMGANVPITGGTPPPTLPGGNAQGMYQVSDFDRQGIQKDIMSTMGKQKFDLLGKLGGPEGIANMAGGVIQGIRQNKGWKAQKKASEAAKNISALTLRAARSRPNEPLRRYYNRPENMVINPEELFPTYGVGSNILSSAKDGAMIGGNPTEIQNMYNPGDMYSDLGYEPMNESDIVKQYEEGGYVPKAQLGNIMGQLGGVSGILNQAGGLTGTGANTSGLYSSIGNIASKLVPGGAGAALGGFGALAQFAINDQRARTLKNNAEAAQRNLQQAGFESGIQGLQGQYASFMKNGGAVDSDYEWLSHTWQPQVITKFGDVDVSQIHSIATEGMDTLRTGGRITQNNMYETDQFNFGGELQTTWGGRAEPISYNPYLPGSGETVMFRGNSHEEKDNKGRTGIGVKYGNDGNYSPYMEYGKDGIESKTDVEVERGEPATELQDSTGDTSMVVFGNLKIPKQFIGEIGDDSIKYGEKFKTYANRISKDEAKQNKLIEKAMELIDINDDGTIFGNIALESARATVEGAKQKLWQIAQYKQNAAAVQNAINETAEENMIDADALAKGKIKPDKEAMAEQAKLGKAIKKAQTGDYKKIAKKAGFIDYNPIGTTSDEMFKDLGSYRSQWIPKVQSAFSDPTNAEQIVKSIENYTGQDAADVVNLIKKQPTLEKKIEVAKRLATDEKPGPYHSLVKNIITTKKPDDTPKTTEEKKTETTTPTTGPTTTIVPALPTKEKKKPDWLAGLNTLLPYLQRPYEEPMDMAQLYPEMMALSMNTLEPVKAQGVQPLLETPYDISFQDQLNEITAAERAAQKMSMGDPSALANVAAQSQAAKSKVLAEQFRANQAMKAGVYGRNRETLNQAQLQNLQIFADQEQKQQLAKAKTKATALEAMGSMADKIAKQKLENKTLAAYSNMFPNYRFMPGDMRALPSGLTLFPTPVVGSTASTDKTEKTSKKKKTEEDSDETTARKGKLIKKNNFNGSIVKALKNI
jgi:hypothetical protein